MNQLQLGGHRCASWALNISRNGDCTASLGSGLSVWPAYWLKNSFAVWNQSSLCPLVSVTSYPSSVHLWEESHPLLSSASPGPGVAGGSNAPPTPSLLLMAEQTNSPGCSFHTLCSSPLTALVALICVCSYLTGACDSWSRRGSLLGPQSTACAMSPCHAQPVAVAHFLLLWPLWSAPAFCGHCPLAVLLEHRNNEHGNGGKSGLLSDRP